MGPKVGHNRKTRNQKTTKKLEKIASGPIVAAIYSEQGLTHPHPLFDATRAIDPWPSSWPWHEFTSPPGVVTVTCGHLAIAIFRSRRLRNDQNGTKTKFFNKKQIFVEVGPQSMLRPNHKLRVKIGCPKMILTRVLPLKVGQKQPIPAFYHQLPKFPCIGTVLIFHSHLESALF